MKTRVFNLIIVDESGSMASIRHQALSGMNETLQTIRLRAEKEPNMEQHVTLITFDSEHTKYHYDNAEGTVVVPLNKRDYQPGACTPLYDAIGNGIAKLNAVVEQGDTVLVTIITDGYENASREYNLRMVRNLIEKLKKQEWTFTFIGTDDLDVEGMANSLGIRHSMSFGHDPEDTEKMWAEQNLMRENFYSRVSEKLINPCKMIMDDDEDFFEKKHV